MIQTINAPISVTLIYDHKNNQVKPSILLWEGREFKVSKIGYHHTYRQGRALVHVFSVATSNMFFRLVLNSETLSWRVEQIADAEAN